MITTASRTNKKSNYHWLTIARELEINLFAETSAINKYLSNHISNFQFFFVILVFV